MKKIKKAVLAYSGGLDTSVIIPWLKENYGCEVIAVCCNAGQGKELEGLEERALASGASKCYIEDVTREVVEDCIFPGIKAGAVYEGAYLLGTAFARPIMAKRIVEIALKEGADAFVHGATGKGNDQVRFELAVKAIAPHLEILAPWRVWDLQSRDDEIEYAEKHNIHLNTTKEESYSKDGNIWHLSHEGLDLEDVGNEPNYDKILELGVTPEKAPDVPTYVTISFEKGIPVAIDGKKMDSVALVEKLNKLGGENGVGIIDIVENRLVGMKSRGVYETPGGTILYYAHKCLENITVDKETQHYKELISHKFAEILYNGQWFTPLRVALSAFVDKTQETVTGDVKIKLYKGNITVAGTFSDYSLYSESIVTFGAGGIYNQKDADGFINLFGLPLTVRALANEELKKQGKSLPDVF